jgi:hypothetical protein
MYIVTLVLFAIPVSLLSAAWFNWSRPSDPEKTDAKKYPRWREHCELAALILAMVATFLNLISWLSWFHNGGSPHGMCPPLGLWKPTGRAAFPAFIAAMVLTIFATGKIRWLVAGCGAALVVAECMISALEMD